MVLNSQIHNGDGKWHNTLLITLDQEETVTHLH